MALESRYNGCDLIVSRREVSVLEIVRQGVSLDLAGNWKVNTMDRIYYQVLVSPPLYRYDLFVSRHMRLKQDSEFVLSFRTQNAGDWSMLN